MKVVVCVSNSFVWIFVSEKFPILFFSLNCKGELLRSSSLIFMETTSLASLASSARSACRVAPQSPNSPLRSTALQGFGTLSGEPWNFPTRSWSSPTWSTSWCLQQTSVRQKSWKTWAPRTARTALPKRGEEELSCWTQKKTHTSWSMMSSLLWKHFASSTEFPPSGFQSWRRSAQVNSMHRNWKTLVSVVFSSHQSSRC